MATYRFYNPVPVIFDIQGLKPAIGGSLTFYDKGTSTPKATHADQAGTVPNPNPMTLDGSGRPTTDIWLTGAYTVVAKTAGGVVIDEADIDTPVPPGVALPFPAAGKFIQGNGTQWVAVDLFLLPDPTGSDGFAVVASGGGYGLAPFPTATQPEIVLTGSGAAGSFRAGTTASTTKYLRQWGNATAPSNAGAKTTSLSVVYPTAFADTPQPFVVMNGAGFTNAGSYPDLGITAKSPTGFTVKFDSQRGESNSDMNLSAAIPFGWMAEGTVVVAP